MTGLWPGASADALGGPSSLVVRVDDASQVGEARRTAESLAAAAGLSDTERGVVAVIATEVATNLANHATGGRILIGIRGDEGAQGIELLSIDDGPGIASVPRAMEDHYSTAGTAGQGLGAIERMAHEFDLFSQLAPRPRATPSGIAGPSGGTVLVARVWSAAAQRARAADARQAAVGALSVPLAGERENGDAWIVLQERDRRLAVVVDGLGHGPQAAEASSGAMRVVREHAAASPVDVVRAVHAALRSTRGAAIAVAVIDAARGQLAFAGVGNVAAAVHTPGESKSLASHNGTVGHEMARLQEFTYDWPAGATLVMHSDGINTRWRADAYPGILRYDPSLLAAVLFRDAARGRDDATVLVLRERAR